MASSTRKVFLVLLLGSGVLLTTLYYHLQLGDVLTSQVCKKVFYVYETDDIDYPPNDAAAAGPGTAVQSQRKSTAVAPPAVDSASIRQTTTAPPTSTEDSIEGAGIRGPAQEEDPSLCPNEPHEDAGPIPVRQLVLPLETLEQTFTFLQPGGKSRPEDCKARYRVAILIPYRDRRDHLHILLRHIHPFLRRQNLDYGIFLIEQTAGSTFNRGLLYNAGFKELTTRFPDYYQCIILHDVDLLPEDDRIIYNCSDPPRHLSGHRNIYNYTLRYPGYWGGVLELKSELYQKINGFSNVYFGWGAEDDDLRFRLQDRDVEVQRYPESWGRYTMAMHEDAERNELRTQILRNSNVRVPIDGLNSVEYELVSYREQPLYTNITVKINERRVIEHFYERTRRLFPWLKALVNKVRDEYPTGPKGKPKTVYKRKYKHVDPKAIRKQAAAEEEKAKQLKELEKVLDDEYN